MKKLSLIMAALLVSVMTFADVLYTLDTTEEDLQGSKNAYAESCDVTVDDITWNFTGNAKINPWRVGGKNLTEVDRLVYTKTAFPQAIDSVVLTIGNITATLNSVKLYYSLAEDFTDAVAVEAKKAVGANTDLTFAITDGFPVGSYFKFVFNITTSGSGNQYVQFSKVVFHGTASEIVTAPEISAVEDKFVDNTTVTITAEEGMNIYYTLDGTTPTTESTLYEASFTIDATTTVKAIAVSTDGKSSVIASKTFTKLTIINILDAITATVGEEVTVQGQVMAVANAGVVIQDASSFIYVYTYDLGLSVGQIVRITGTIGVYQEMNQITKATATMIQAEGTPIYTTPEVWTSETMDSWLAAPYRHYVQVEGKLVINETHYDVTVEGTTNQISIIKGADLTDLNGKTIVITGYAMYAKTDESVKSACIVPTSVVEKGASTGIDNMTVENKARKVVENGVIYIMRNGVRYNALGGMVE